MEKTKTVWLGNKFEIVWESLNKLENGVELETGEFKTRFISKAAMAKRTARATKKVLVFLKYTSDGKLRECSRCYEEDWGFYFNHLGKQGQRIGMYCLAVDCWVTVKKD
jgi:glycine cleavage system aminomethyltransferase T